MKVVFLKIQENIDIVSGLCMLNIISPSLVSVISWKLQNFQINFYTYIFSSSLNKNFIKIILFFASKQLFATLSLKKNQLSTTRFEGFLIQLFQWKLQTNISLQRNNTIIKPSRVFRNNLRKLQLFITKDSRMTGNFVELLYLSSFFKPSLLSCFIDQASRPFATWCDRYAEITFLASSKHTLAKHFFSPSPPSRKNTKSENSSVHCRQLA